MKKLYLLLVGFILFPTIIFASSSYGSLDDGGFFISGKNYYAAGGNVNISQDIEGDLYAAGGMININNNVGEDLVIAGGMIRIIGNVGGDIRIVGGNITIEGNVDGDLIVNGGQIIIGKNSKILGNTILNGGNVQFNGNTAGDAYINGGEFILNGEIGGNTEIAMEKISLLNTGIIKGNLIYFSEKQNLKLESIVSGKKEFKILKNKEIGKGVSKGFLGIITTYLLYNYLFLLVFGIILYFTFEKLLKETALILEKSYWKSFFLGLAYYAIFPFLIVLLFLTIIGIPFSFFLLFVYIFSFVFYKLFIVIVFSSLIINKYLAKGKIIKNYIPFWKKIGIIALVTFIVVPWSLIDLFAAFFAVGAIGLKKFEIYKSLK